MGEGTPTSTRKADHLRINISDEDAREIKSVGDAVRYIDSHKA